MHRVRHGRCRKDVHRERRRNFFRLSESLRAVVSQRLLARADGNGRVPALETLIVTKAVANLIRENKVFQINSILQTGRRQGMQLLERSIDHLLADGIITEKEASRHRTPSTKQAP